MGVNRVLGRCSATVIGAVAMLPALALLVAVAFDQGPSGKVRPTLFPIALAALDDSIWQCARNSLAVAIAVTIASRTVGVTLARIVVRWRFWGRKPLVALACSGLVIAPAFGAMGLKHWFGPLGVWPVTGGVAWFAYLAWFWTALTFGVPLVGLAAAAGLARVDASWEDAARLAGADRRRVWRQIVWPLIRPDIARALALVFALTLIEPGAPLVLGLRRTLGFQITMAALDPNPGRLTRAAVLALAGVALAGLGRVLIGWWGGSKVEERARIVTPEERIRTAGPARGLAFVLILLIAAVGVWLPIVGVVSAALTGTETYALSGIVRDPMIRRYAVNSAILGLAVVAIDLVLARALAACSGAGRKPGRDRVFPPLALGVGFLAIPWVVRMLAVGLQTSGHRPTIVAVLTAMADAFDPKRTPWVALIGAVALARLPLLTRSAVARRESLRTSPIDAALILGASRRQSRRRLSGRWLGVSPATAVLSLTLAATGVTPALLLAPSAETRPIGPAVLVLIDEPGDGFRRASALATLAIALNLGALAYGAMVQAKPGGLTDQT